MKKIVLLTSVVFITLLSACQKKNNSTGSVYGNLPRTEVPASLQGKWMYGNFSLTEYWSQNPADYLGNALQYAIAFKFNPDGTFEQYFTSSSVSSGIVTYQQSVTKGTVEVDAAGGKIVTHAYSAHYKRTRSGQTVEERDLAQSELNGTTHYSYTSGVEPGGVKAIYLLLQGTNSPLTFIQKF